MLKNYLQEKFCLEYVASGNATVSYQKAYDVTSKASAAVSASKLLRNPKVQERLEELQDEIASRKIAESRELQEKLTQIIRGQAEEEVILQGGERIKKQVAIKDVLKAIEILCRIQGLFVVKQEVNLNTAPIVIAGGDWLED